MSSLKPDSNNNTQSPIFNNEKRTDYDHDYDDKKNENNKEKGSRDNYRSRNQKEEISCDYYKDEDDGNGDYDYDDYKKVRDDSHETAETMTVKSSSYLIQFIEYLKLFMKCVTIDSKNHHEREISIFQKLPAVRIKNYY